MKVMLCHTYYTQRGGEDQSFEDERDLLLSHGHQVVEYVRRNDELQGVMPLTTAIRTLWNRHAARDVSALIHRHRPDVLHATNTFPLVSPSVLSAARREGVAVVQALRNYRLLCANAYLMRDGRPCESCIGRLVSWPAVLNRCYHNSVAATAAVSAMQALHRALGTWKKAVNVFFTLTEFARGKFIDGGFDPARIVVKQNCVQPDPGPGDGGGGYAVFAGRLSPEKGIDTLLDAWRSAVDLPRLQIVGDGPMLNSVQAAARRDGRITVHGHVPSTVAQQVIGGAAVLIAPSHWYETFCRTIAEAYAAGTPVVASRLGAMAELVDDWRTGRLFAAGDARDLTAKVRDVLDATPEQRAALRRRAREAYEKQFTPQRSYARLLEIYELARRRSMELHRHNGIPMSADIALRSPDSTNLASNT